MPAMAKLALLVALLALGVAILAYQETGGSKDLSRRLDTLRQETAESLSKMEKALRPGGVKP
jgi:hypothetical protein